MNSNVTKAAANGKEYHAFFFSDILDRRVCETRRVFEIGKLTDLVFRMAEPYPEAVGIFISHGWGNPSEFIPWDRVVKMEKGVIFVQPPEKGEQYPPFVDKPGWLLVNEHLMGKTILDMDERRIEVVNDVHLIDYKVRVVNPRAGTAAKVRVVIESRDHENIWSTVGVSENIIEASWQALVDSVEYKLLAEEAKKA